MNINEAINLLSEAELKQLAIKDNRVAVLGYLNLGVLELHKRFQLITREAIIIQETGVKDYRLDGTDANVTIDLSTHDMLLCEDAYDGDDNFLPINSSKRGLTPRLFTPEFNVIRIPVPLEYDPITINYRAAPKFLTKDEDIIPLPPQFLEALFNYVGYRGHSSVKGDIKSENNTHYQRFEASCAKIDFHSLGIQDEMDSDKFTMRGFV